MTRLNANTLRIGFIGAGRAAKTLAIGLCNQGYDVACVSSRTLASAEQLAANITGCRPAKTAQEVANACDTIFITAPDDAIEQIVLGVRWHTGTNLIHCSGVESTNILDNARAYGVSTGSFHPMQTFTSEKQPDSHLQGVAFAIEGPSHLKEILRRMAQDLGGWTVEIRPEHKALYHASGFLTCGLITGILGQATALWNVMDSDDQEGFKVLLPLLASTVKNLETQGVSKSMTGPISRGDTGTIRKHIEALETYAPNVLPLYCESAIATARICWNTLDIDSDKQQEIIDLLESHTNGPKSIIGN